MTEIPSSPCRRFAAKIFILVVGADRRRLYVPEAILRKIEWFNKEIEASQTTVTISLPSSDPSALSTLFHLVEQSLIPSLAPNGSPTKSTTVRNQTDKKVNLYIGAYVEAARFGMEALETSLVDSIISYYSNALVLPEAVTVLVQGGGAGSMLYDLLLEKMAHGIQAGFYNQRQNNSSLILDDLKPEHKRAMDLWRSSDFVTLLAQVGSYTPRKKRGIPLVSKNGALMADTHLKEALCTSSPARSISPNSCGILETRYEGTEPQKRNQTTPIFRKMIDFDDSNHEAVQQYQRDRSQIQSPVSEDVNKSSRDQGHQYASKSRDPLELVGEPHDVRSRQHITEALAGTGKRKRSLQEALDGDDSLLKSFANVCPRSQVPASMPEFSTVSVAPSIELEADQSPEIPIFKHARVLCDTPTSWERSQTVRSETPLFTDEEFYSSYGSLLASRADHRTPTPDYESNKPHYEPLCERD